MVDDMKGEWWIIWRGSGGRYGGGVVEDMVHHSPPNHPPLPLHIRMKVRTHTHILVCVMTGQKMARNQEMLQWGQLMSPPTIKIKDEKYKYFLANTYKHTHTHTCWDERR